jgi:predicted anti-sigma-YlaC factor YlaD
MTMCDRTRRALSAALDGERELGDDTRRHLAGCAACEAWARRVGDLATTVGAARAAEPPPPDLTGPILAAYRASRRQAEPEPWLRWSLLLVALVQLAVALPDLLGSGRGDIAHAHRDLSAWDAAFAFGLVWAARRPRQASGLLPFAVALAGVLAFSSVADMVAGRVPGVTELPHALALFGLALLWQMTRPLPPRPGRRSPTRTA